MENKICKKCNKILPVTYKYKKCEACRNKSSENSKKIIKGFLSIVSVLVVTIVGNNKINKK